MNHDQACRATEARRGSSLGVAGGRLARTQCPRQRRIEASGLHREDFNIELQGDTLTVRGEKRSDREVSRGRYSVLQCAYGRFRRDVALPVAVKAGKTKASYRDGVLRIELAKADEARARRIEVKTA
jgi:HSP20 family protein